MISAISLLNHHIHISLPCNLCLEAFRPLDSMNNMECKLQKMKGMTGKIFKRLKIIQAICYLRTDKVIPANSFKGRFVICHSNLKMESALRLCLRSIRWRGCDVGGSWWIHHLFLETRVRSCMVSNKGEKSKTKSMIKTIREKWDELTILLCKSFCEMWKLHLNKRKDQELCLLMFCIICKNNQTKSTEIPSLLVVKLS